MEMSHKYVTKKSDGTPAHSQKQQTTFMNTTHNQANFLNWRKLGNVTWRGERSSMREMIKGHWQKVMLATALWSKRCEWGSFIAQRLFANTNFESYHSLFIPFLRLCITCMICIFLFHPTFVILKTIREMPSFLS